MTLDQWLDRRELVPPLALRRRLKVAARSTPEAAALAVPEAALESSLELLAGLLHRADPSRSGAIELLTVDALMTYAFEGAADTPERLEALGELAMERIAALAGDHCA